MEKAELVGVGTPRSSSGPRRGREDSLFARPRSFPACVIASDDEWLAPHSCGSSRARAPPGRPCAWPGGSIDRKAVVLG